MILNRRNLALLKNAYNIYGRSNDSLEDDFKRFEFYEQLNFKWKKENFVISFKENFFSLLMVSLLINSCKDENIKNYSKLITCIRQIITSTDNIIDAEDKGVVFIDEISNTVVKNTLLTMASQNILEKISVELTGDNTISRAIINKIYKIAAAESKRDEEQYELYPTPDYVKNIIHEGIGGELLEISMLAPKIIEKNQSIEGYSKGLFNIGMGLQSLDDLCDIEEDLRENKVNYAVAKLIKDGYSLNILKQNPTIQVEDDFIKNYLSEVLKDTLKGFDLLIASGFPLTRGDIDILLKHLFKIRGLDKFWKMLKVLKVKGESNEKDINNSYSAVSSSN